MGTRTFLFVDQVGSTEQLTRLGDAVAQPLRRALFDTLRQATEVHGGHEVDFTGDGLFCAFTGAADAVDAAVAMQQLVVSFNARRPAEQHLGIRIGLHTGEPLTSEGGGYFGAAVVVGARLCARAVAGQVLASGLVRALVGPRGVHVFEPVGALALKGVPEPVETFAVGWVPDERAGALPGLLAAARTGPFVGREAELAAVEAAWEQVTGGGRRRLVLVSADHGMGVSRLLAEAAERLRAGGASVWAGAGQGPEGRLAAWAETISAWAAATPRAELRLALGQRAADLRRLVPALAEAVPGLPQPPPVEPAAEVFLIADAVDELVERWSGVQPLVVVLDDLHEADPASLTVLHRLLTSRRGGRVLVLAGYEPAAVGAPAVLAQLRGVDAVVDLRPTGLPAGEVALLLAELAGRPVEEATVRGVLAESEGSPYFVVEIGRSLKQRTLTEQVERTVGRVGELRTDLRLQREEMELALRELEQLRVDDLVPDGVRVETDGTAPAPGEPPYRGLLPFQPEDAEVFFGRDALVAEMVAALVSSSWLTVVGASGSGKSSAVRAGLLPALARGAVPGSAEWVPVLLSPGPDPLGALAAALTAAAPAQAAVEVSALEGNGLPALAEQRLDGRRALVIVDQFEELWTAAAEDARQRLLALLTDAVADDGRRLVVLVCVRADYYDRLTEHPDLARLLGEAQVAVPAMTTAELRSAVELPARRAGWVLEPGLAQAVVDDVAGEPGGLPLLSTAMLETWHRRRGRSLTLAGYAETGGARRAIATLADATVDELELGRQEAARRLLLRLAAPVAGGGDVARPASLAELVAGEESRAVLGHLVDRRLVTVGAGTAQVAHEALLREWPRLRGWLEADREGRRLHQQIATAATDWDAGGRDDGVLLRGARLAAAQDWRGGHEDELTGVEREFLTASADAQQAQLRRARRTTRRFQLLAVGLVVLLVGAAVAAGLAVVNGREATDRATEATAGRLAAQAVALTDSQVDVALLLAVEAHRRQDSPDTRAGLLQALHAARHMAGVRQELPAGARSASVAADAERVAIGTLAGEVQVFDTTTWQPVGPALSLGEGFHWAALSPDGQRLAVITDGGLHLVDVGTGDVGSPSAAAEGIAEFSPDGRHLVVLSSDGTVTVLDAATGTERSTFSVPEPMRAVLHPGADELVVLDGFRGAMQRRSIDGALLASRSPDRGDPPRDVLDVRYTRDGRHLLLLTVAFGPSGSDQRIDVLDAATLQPPAEGSAAPASIPSAGDPTAGSHAVSWDVAPSGEAVALGNQGGTVDVLDLATGAPIARLEGIAGGEVGVWWLDDTRLLALTVSASIEYDLSGESPITVQRRGPSLVTDVTRADQGTAVYVDEGAPALGRTDAALGDLGSVPLDLPRGTTFGKVTLSPDAGTAAVLAAASVDPVTGASEDVAVVLLDRESGDQRQFLVPEVTGFDPGGTTLAFSPDGARLAVSDPSPGPLRVLDVPTGQWGDPLGDSQVGTLDLTVARSVLWHSAERLLVGDYVGNLTAVDPDDGRVLTTRTLAAGAITSLALLDDGRTIAASSTAGQVWLLDAEDLTPRRPPLSPGPVELHAVAAAPGGDTLVAADAQGDLWWWDLRSGQSAGAPLSGTGLPLGGITVTDDGRHLLGGGHRSGLISWSLDPAVWADEACDLVGRSLTTEEWSSYLTDEEYRPTCPTP